MLCAFPPNQPLARTAASAKNPAVDIRMFMTSSPRMVCPLRGS
jgi:hypothetical protein